MTQQVKFSHLSIEALEDRCCPATTLLTSLDVDLYENPWTPVIRSPGSYPSSKGFISQVIYNMNMSLILSQSEMILVPPKEYELLPYPFDGVLNLNKIVAPPIKIHPSIVGPFEK